jgi:hypothetical protein
LALFEARVLFVNDIDFAAPPDDLAVCGAPLDGGSDFHKFLGLVKTDDPSLGQIIGREFYSYVSAWQDPNEA